MISRELKKRWSREWELNPRPADYESAALPLSYLGPLKRKDLLLYCVPIWLNLNQTSIILQSNCNQACFPVCPLSLQFSEWGTSHPPDFHEASFRDAALTKLWEEPLSYGSDELRSDSSFVPFLSQVLAVEYSYS